MTRPVAAIPRKRPVWVPVPHKRAASHCHVDQQTLQLPLIVRRCLDHRAQTGDVSAKPFRRAVDVVSDELAKFVEPMLVAPLEIAPVEDQQILPF